MAIKTYTSATGDRSASSAIGDWSASITTGWYSQSEIINNDNKESKGSVAIGIGYKNKARATTGSWIVLACRNYKDEIIHIKSAKVGDELKADTWYELDDNGDFQEVQV